jgi:hypothetical protein
VEEGEAQRDAATRLGFHHAALAFLSTRVINERLSRIELRSFTPRREL